MARAGRPRVEICVPIALCMSSVFDISRKEIGEALGCSSSVVTERLHAAGYRRGKSSNCSRRGRMEHDKALAEFKRRIADEYGGRFEVIDHAAHSSTLKCSECGETFHTSARSIKCPTCSKIERERAKAERGREKRRARMERLEDMLARPQTCEWCGGEFHAARVQRFCSSNCAKRSAYRRKQEKDIRICPECGERFTRADGGYRFCSRKCAKKALHRKYRSGNHRHRARQYGVEYEPGITLRKVYEKDGGICYLCGQSTDWDDIRESGEGYAAGPSYPTIDHVVPMSKGGSHTWNNVRLACHRCNSCKGADDVEGQRAIKS